MDLSKRKMDHLNLNVPNIVKARDFYVNTMQYEVTDEFQSPDGKMKVCYLSNGNGLVLELLENTAIEKTVFDHIAYVTDDIHADFAYFKSKGCEFITPEVSYLDFFFDNGVDYFLFKGEGGEVIEFCAKR